MVSLSRQLAQWVVGLRYDDLPPPVIDRPWRSRFTVSPPYSVLRGSQTTGDQQSVQLITGEESGVSCGATIMVDGGTVTNGG